MLEIRETETFSAWLRALRDSQARARIAARIRRLAFGNPGDVCSVGEGISELRVHWAGIQGLLREAGCSVDSPALRWRQEHQERDIATAKRLAKEIT